MASKDKRRRDRERQRQQHEQKRPSTPPPIRAAPRTPTAKAESKPKWECRLEQKALREGWVENQSTRDAIAERLAGIILNPAMKARYVITAAKTLIQADVAQQRIDAAAKASAADSGTTDDTIAPEVAAQIKEAYQSAKYPTLSPRPSEIQGPETPATSGTG